MAAQDHEKSLRFIAEVQKHRVLWEKKNYKNVVLKGDAWAAIAAKEEVSPQDAKHLWSRLLGIYRTNKVKVKNTTQTGAGNDDVFRPRWFAYHAMSFVDEATQDAVHVDTLGYDDEGLTPRSLVEAAYAVPQSLDDIDWDAAVAFDPEPFSPTPSSYPSALSVTPGTIREGNGVSGALNNRLQQPVSGATGAPETADPDDFG
uniref:MADF domain-containing protein n=1 Tax=Anopheles quadriannulatus TaxID=34691 RepID=A0A182XPR3_ANOQN